MPPAFLNPNGPKEKVEVVQLSSGGAKREALLQGRRVSPWAGRPRLTGKAHRISCSSTAA